MKRWPVVLVLTAGVVIFAGAVLIIASTRSSDSERRIPEKFPLSSYYFEARIYSPEAPQNTPQTVIKGWYQAPNRTRWEMGCEGHTLCEANTRILIVQSGEMLLYEPGTNTYFRVDTTPVSEDPEPFLSNFQPGPLVRGLRIEIGQNAKLIGRAEMLGRDTGIYEFEDFGRFWIDEKHAFVLRQEGKVRNPFVVEVTKADYNSKFSDEVFVFKPPTDAREVEPPSSTRSFSSGSIPRPFLSPSYLPAGYRQTGSLAEGDRLFEAEFNSGALRIEQDFRAGGPLIGATGTSVGAPGGPRFESRNGTSYVLAWIEGDLKITISSILPFEELHRIADSMR